MRPNRLVLYSDQEIPENRKIDRILLNMLTGSEKSMAYIASSTVNSTRYFQHKKSYYAEIGVTLAEYFDETTLNSPEVLKRLCAYPAIHLSGGNTYHFRDWIFELAVHEALTAYSKSGGLLVGTSAGAILLTPDINTAQLCGDSPPPGKHDTSGVGLADFYLWPHYITEAASSAEVLARLDPSKTLYRVPDGAGIVVNGDNVEAIGGVLS